MPLRTIIQWAWNCFGLKPTINLLLACFIRIKSFVTVLFSPFVSSFLFSDKLLQCRYDKISACQIPRRCAGTYEIVKVRKVCHDEQLHLHAKLFPRWIPFESLKGDARRNIWIARTRTTKSIIVFCFSCCYYWNLLKVNNPTACIPLQLLFNYRETEGNMDIVLFNDALEHLGAIHRIIRLDGGNALLVGVSGSGKKCLACLGAYIANAKTYEIVLRRGYGENEFRDDLKKLYTSMSTSKSDFMFLVCEDHIRDECEFLMFEIK